MIEELAVGAQFKLPYIHVLVNNSYLGLIRQAQRGFDMDYCVQLAFDNINAPELEGYGVDHVAVVEGLGCKAIRVFDPNEIGAALAKARELMQQHQVPVVVEVILERITNISMGTEINAQFKLPYIHVLVNNSYLGLIRQAQRGFDMDYCVQLAFDNINAPELEGYGVDHVAVVEGLGCKAIRVFDPNEIGAALAKARELMQQHQVPVVVEVILERITNISMGTEINAINEFEELAEKGADAPTAISLLD